MRDSCRQQTAWQVHTAISTQPSKRNLTMRITLQSPVALSHMRAMITP